MAKPIAYSGASLGGVLSHAYVHATQQALNVSFEREHSVSSWECLPSTVNPRRETTNMNMNPLDPSIGPEPSRLCTALPKFCGLYHQEVFPRRVSLTIVISSALFVPPGPAIAQILVDGTVEVSDVPITVSTTASVTPALHVINGGSFTANATATLTTEGADSHVMFTRNGTVNLLGGGSLTAVGTSAKGIYADGGNVTAQQVEINTSGFLGHGVYATAGGQTTLTGGGRIETSGDSGVGLYSAGTVGGGTRITTSGPMSIVTRGIAADGIRAVAKGSIELGDAASGGDARINVETFGNGSAGVTAIQSEVTLRSVDIVTHGDRSGPVTAAIGVNAVDGGNITLNDSTIMTSGITGDAISASSGGAVVTMNGGSIFTSGPQSKGVVSYGGGSSIELTDVDVSTSGAASRGIVASEAGSSLTMTRGSITTGTADSIGAQAIANGTLVLNDVAVNTAGERAHGVQAARGGRVAYTGTGSIAASGAAAYGLYSTGAGSQIDANGLNVSTSGDYGHASAVIAGGDLNLSDSNLRTKGANAAALFLNSDAGETTTASLTRTTLASESASSISVNAGTANISLVSSQALINDGSWLSVGAGAIANLSIEDSHLRGSVVTPTTSVSSVALSNSRWDMTESSTVSELVNNASAIQFGAPLADATQSSSYKTLTVNNYSGLGGTIGLNTYLGGDGSPSDRVVIASGQGAGQTALLIAPTGGGGVLTTGDGIKVIDAMGASSTTSDAFVLGNRVAAGAYEYKLHKGGRSGSELDTGSQNWYLRNTIPVENPDNIVPPEPPQPPAPPAPPATPETEIPDYRAEVPVDMVVPALAHRFGLEMLGTYHDRVGEDAIGGSDEASRNNPAGRHRAWGRFFGESGNVDHAGGSARKRFDEFISNGPRYDFDMWGFQAGVDLLDEKRDGGARDIAGVYLGGGRIDADVDGVLGGKAGTASMNGFSIGGYWTRKSDKGWYVDGVLQATRYDRVRTSSIMGERLDSNGWGVIASAEGGRPFELGNDWTVEPQTQLVYQHVSLSENVSDSFGRISYGDSDNLYGRLGARLAKKWQTGDGRLITAWARANVWHSFGADAETTFSTLDGKNPVTMKASLGDTWGQMGLGLSAQVAKTVNVFGALDYNAAMGSGDGSSVSGRIGIRVAW